MQIDLSGLRAVITAGGSGIGRVIANTLAQSGAKVAVCDVSEAALADLPRMADASDASIAGALADVSDPDGVATFVEEAAGWMGGIDILVNNAGISGPTRAVGEIAPEEWRQVMEINVNAQFYTLRAALPYLKRSDNPSVFNMSSTAGRLGMPLRAPYSVSKYAVRGFTDVLAVELGEFGIRVNSILPGIVNGERGRRVMGEQAASQGMTFDEYLPRILHNVSMHAMVEPAEIAGMVAFVASPLGRHISGQSIGICGNMETYRGPIVETGPGVANVD